MWHEYFDKQTELHAEKQIIDLTLTNCFDTLVKNKGEKDGQDIQI